MMLASQSRWVGFFLLGFWIVIASATTLNSTTVGSPDEAANVRFAERFFTNHEFSIPTKLTPPELQFFHPRSVVVDGQAIKPLSFVGFLLALGWASPTVAKLITPIVAGLALLALYAIFRRFWSPWWSLLGAALVSLHPVWFQFQTLPYYQNGLFTSFIIIAGWQLMRLWNNPKWRNALWLGLAYGGALFIRPIEVIWTGPLIAIILLAMPGGWRWLLASSGVTILLQLPWFIVGQQLYGPSIGAGYQAAQLGSATGSADWFRPVRTILTPSSGWSWHWLSSAWWYLLLVVPTWSVMSVVAVVMYLRRIQQNRLKLLKISLVILTLAYFLAYYGSWNLYPLEAASTVGSLASYGRYWLPLHVAMVVGVLWFLKRLAAQRWALGAVLAALVVSQASTIVFHPSSGLVARFEQDRTQVTKRTAVLDRVPADGLIIAGQWDKVFWPDRLVGFAFPRSAEQLAVLATVTTDRTVWLYVTPFQYDRTKINKQLAPVGLVITEEHQLGSDQLWQIGGL